MTPGRFFDTIRPTATVAIRPGVGESSMKALRIHQLGGPEGLRLDDLPEPTPGPGEAAVRVRAASLNFRDLMVLEGPV